MLEIYQCQNSGCKTNSIIQETKPKTVSSLDLCYVVQLHSWFRLRFSPNLGLLEERGPGLIWVLTGTKPGPTIKG